MSAERTYTREFAAYAALDPLLDQVIQSQSEYWAPEVPPPTVLFGALGRSVVEHWADLSQERRKTVFRKVEIDMDPGDEDFSTVIATGFIEAIVNPFPVDDPLWIEIQTYMGKQTIDYAHAWIAFWEG